MIYGVDVSSVQGHAIDWEAVAASGQRFVFVKVSEGETGRDPERLGNLAGARAHGLIAAVYAFSRVTGDPVVQAANAWGAMGDQVASHIAVDLESAPEGMSGDEILDWAWLHVQAVETYLGRPPLVYTMPGFGYRFADALGRNLLAATALARCPLWVANYRSTSVPWMPLETDRPLVPAPWKKHTLWQFSGNGGYRVPGIPCDVDRNRFDGDEDAFRALWGLPTDDQYEPPATVVGNLDEMVEEAVKDHQDITPKE